MKNSLPSLGDTLPLFDLPVGNPLPPRQQSLRALRRPPAPEVYLELFSPVVAPASLTVPSTWNASLEWPH